MSGAAVSALSRPNDFRPLFAINPSSTITSWRRVSDSHAINPNPQVRNL